MIGSDIAIWTPGRSWSSDSIESYEVLHSANYRSPRLEGKFR